MKRISLNLLVALPVLHAGLPPATAGLMPEEAPASQQRRAELRQFLKSNRASEVAWQTDMSAKGATGRHLSAQERVDLRQQLWQQRRDGKPVSP